VTFIIILLSLLIERFFHWGKHRHWHWLSKYQQSVAVFISKFYPSVQLTLLVFPIVFVIAILQFALRHWLYDVPSLIFGMGVLLYCMGPDNAWLEFLPRAEILKDATEAHQPGAGATFANAFFEAIYQRVFAVIFWFVILGPFGAVLYRLIELFSAESNNVAANARWAKLCLDWLPIRFLTFVFALGGHFTEVWQSFKKNSGHGLESSHPLLSQCGFAALDPPEASDDSILGPEAIALMDRVLVMTLVFFALYVLIT